MIPEGKGGSQDAEELFNKQELKLALLGDGVEFEGLGLGQDYLLGLGLREVAVDCFEDCRRGAEGKVVELHL